MLEKRTPTGYGHSCLGGVGPIAKQLNDLMEKIELDLLRNDTSRYGEHESRYFEIMETATKRWLALKRD